MIDYWSCVTCGHLTQNSTGFCSYCNSPLPNFLQSRSDFRIPKEAFAYHFAFYGVTGTGKTRAAMQLVREAENSGLKILILDVEGEWKNLIPHFKNKTEYYATGKNLKINPFEVGDEGLVKLLLKETLFKGIEVEYQELSPQMNYVLDKCIAISKSIPELIDNVMNYEGKELSFKLSSLDKTKTALLVRLGPFRNNQALREIFHCTSSSLDLNELDDRNIVIDLHELERQVAYKDEVRMIYNTIATAYLRLALSREPTDEVTNIFVADEAQLLAPKIIKKLVSTDTWTTTEFATRLRKRGQSLAIICQSPSNIEDDIRKNCQNNFFFRIQAAEDIKIVAGMLGYNSSATLDYFTSYIGNLSQRQSIVKTPLVGEPFVITSPEIRIIQIGHKQLAQFMPKTSEDFSQLEIEFLESINNEPFIPMTERRDRLGWDRKTYADIVRKLKENATIEQVTVPLGRSRPLVLYQLSGKNPSIKHEFYIYWIIEKLADKGIVCRAEKIGPDIQIPSLNAAINVELGKSSLEQNVTTALNQFETVVIASDSKKVLDRITISEFKEGKKVLKSLIWDVPNLFRLDGS